MKLRNLYVFVQNTQRAVKFYTKILGFELLRKQDRYTILKIDGVWFGLLNEEFIEDKTIRGNNCVPVFKVENIETESARLQGLGVKFVTGIETLPDAKLFQFYDSEGNILEMYQEQ